VIGRAARNVSVATALEHVAGYTIANDLSARDHLKREGVAPTSPFYFDWVRQKPFDGSLPLGPWITPACQVNEELMQELARVLKPGGRLYLTVPYGVYEHHGFQQVFDADRLATLHVPVTQLNTDPGFGGECHLDANMVRSAIPALPLEEFDLLLVENVGNLVCPAEFRIGELDRLPLPDEAAHCREYLERQLELVQPKFICALGACAAQNLLGTKLSIGKLRGQFQQYRGIPVLCTYHPAYLLRSPDKKRDVWEDMKKLLQRMGRAVPAGK